jgi:predicted transcriptional regulator
MKGKDGMFHLTNFGRLLFHLTTSQKFVLRNQEYFLSHSVSKIPLEFVYRIGELENGTLIKGVMKVIGFIEQSIQKAENEIQIMYDQILPSSKPMIEEKIRKGLKFSQVIPEDTQPSEFIIQQNGNMRERRLREIRNFVLLTEKEAIVTFSTLTGKVDYNEAFYLHDENTQKWCSDLFTYFWEKSNKGFTV